MMEVVGRAAPFNEPNAFNEILLPGAFTRFLARHRGLLPMGAGHEMGVGFWTHLYVAKDGLYARGVVANPGAMRLVRNGTLPDLSVSYGDVETREKRLYHCTRRARYMGEGKFLRRVIPEADLTEISLVDHGAYKGTDFRWVDLSDKKG